ncbi:FAD-dependent monooxygenase [Halogeometricum limi]|uniref:FAD-binding domain-containing protein n=1 Tax=Halogeometricum limi TaxID=555875 RepID=A0A1I6GHX1_9EURY|nr:FAD-dependent monooxygenase [Halogeometricum limi]SFR41795.1 hypothetical protein SAMN04488124_1071 [Halogeometricum limi]
MGADEHAETDAERAEDATSEADAAFDHDVVVVGGGPTGCSLGVFTGRYGLDTVVFDRGRSSLRQCAYLENYLGFPGGIDVDTLYGLMHDHAEAAGCDVVSEHVAEVRRDGTGYAVTTSDGRTATARRVVAAARYGGDCLEPLGDESMFVTQERDGETRKRFDREYPDDDGRTPFDGLYVAAPVPGANVQAIRSAGHGARVARTVIADVRREQGYPEPLAAHWDWMRRDAELAGDDPDRDDWREWFDDRVPEDCDVDEARLRELREADIDRRLSTYLSEEDVEERTRDAHERLAEHLEAGDDGEGRSVEQSPGR